MFLSLLIILIIALFLKYTYINTHTHVYTHTHTPHTHTHTYIYIYTDTNMRLYSSIFHKSLSYTDFKCRNLNILLMKSFKILKLKKNHKILIVLSGADHFD